MKKKGVVTKSNSSTWPLGYTSVWNISKMEKGRLKEQNNF